YVRDVEVACSSRVIPRSLTLFVKSYFKMQYPKELFTLIYEYSLKYSELTNIELVEVLLTETPIYYAIGNHTWDTDSTSLLWLEYLQGIKDGRRPDDLAYEMYLTHPSEDSRKDYIGCFRYKYVEGEDP